MIFSGRSRFSSEADSFNCSIAGFIFNPMSVRIRVWAWIDWFCFI